jgi:ATP-binding cassette subfamily B (MDR/TAP) protein 1
MLPRFFIIALLATLILFIQNSLFASAAAKLTAKLRSLSFKAILRQDSLYFALFCSEPGLRILSS